MVYLLLYLSTRALILDANKIVKYEEEKKKKGLWCLSYFKMGGVQNPEILDQLQLQSKQEKGA